MEGRVTMGARMEGVLEPAYITSLLSSETEHNCFFIVGDPAKGAVERIGAVAAMLSAQSLVLRRLLSIVESDMGQRWDITITYVQPRAFKNMLRYT
ncbi:hypothetical protein J6590_061199 [Homalodisca vitripennis]|nr:hypothetical protein J6590_061199 [Homalodisca vitripennis]